MEWTRKRWKNRWMDYILIFHCLQCTCNIYRDWYFWYCPKILEWVEFSYHIHHIKTTWCCYLEFQLVLSILWHKKDFSQRFLIMHTCTCIVCCTQCRQQPLLVHLYLTIRRYYMNWLVKLLCSLWYMFIMVIIGHKRYC